MGVALPVLMIGRQLVVTHLCVTGRQVRQRDRMNLIQVCQYRVTHCAVALLLTVTKTTHAVVCGHDNKRRQVRLRVDPSSRPTWLAPSHLCK